MKGLIIALQFLTRLPLPSIQVDDPAFAGSMRWFPAAGLVIGAIVTAAAYTGAAIDPWIGALAALVAWVIITGALHLDGLGDIADACGAAHKDRDRMLAVLADPHIGSFGVVSIVTQMIAKLLLLHALIETGLLSLLPLVPFAARIGPLAWTRWMPPLHPGLAARFAGVIRPIDLIAWSVLVAASAWFSPAMLATPLFIACWGWWLRRRIGGISGDGHGGGIELIESALMATIVVATRLL